MKNAGKYIARNYVQLRSVENVVAQKVFSVKDSIQFNWHIVENLHVTMDRFFFSLSEKWTKTGGEKKGEKELNRFCQTNLI